jgi:hypothetical protein
MQKEQETIEMINQLISELPVSFREQIGVLADVIRAIVKQGGPVVGTLALTLVGAEEQLAAAKEDVEG